MGWASGSELAEEVWCLVREYTPKKERPRIAREIIDCFQGFDCDTLDEARTLTKDSE